MPLFFSTSLSCYLPHLHSSCTQGNGVARHLHFLRGDPPYSKGDAALLAQACPQDLLTKNGFTNCLRQGYLGVQQVVSPPALCWSHQLSGRGKHLLKSTDALAFGYLLCPCPLGYAAERSC
jgi:hypothetical protein